ncbi:MAG: phosphate signaling complex protein PhoU [Thermoguttaceae bacterium]|nr:phosphate signaling complex protein PhoU [Thermoguttaceae bacterium]MDW8078263.1 phosphate signaling complex protein PhoU [Thermoguttaceae bacterium]
MTVHFQRELGKVKDSLLRLSNRALDQVDRAVRSFVERDSALAEQIIRDDKEIDHAEIELEEECLKILALYQPVARDLRFIVCALKMNNDLERIGDLAVNIARKTQTLCKKPPVELPGVLAEMCGAVQQMLRDSVDALVQGQSSLARSVLRRDAEVDEMKRSVRRWAEEVIRSDINLLGPALAIMAASRNLERIADHATNLAEDVIYLVEGEIVRHQAGDGEG